MRFISGMSEIGFTRYVVYLFSHGMANRVSVEIRCLSLSMSSGRRTYFYCPGPCSCSGFSVRMQYTEYFARREQSESRKSSSRRKSRSGIAEEVRRKYNIPEGYCIKNWDHREDPILFCGSVFDANSLGKWIYDWTVCVHGAQHELADIAGDFWLLLIELAGKLKSSQQCMLSVFSADDKQILEDFVISGRRLWKRLLSLLGICETFMLAVGGRKQPRKLGTDAGFRFVECFFGRDEQLKEMEKLMTGMRYWNFRFNANCEDILDCTGGND